MFGVARNAVLTSWAEKGLAKADYVEALDYENVPTKFAKVSGKVSDLV